jgi:hypothetical protein
MKVMVKSATEVREEILEKSGGSAFAERQAQKKPSGWEPKDSKADISPKAKNKKKHRARKIGFSPATGNKSPQKPEAGKKPEQLHPDNGSSHLLRDKMEHGCDG